MKPKSSRIQEGRTSKRGVNSPPTTPPPEPPIGQSGGRHPKLVDQRFLPTKVWTESEMELGTYNFMDETLNYIRHVLIFKIKYKVLKTRPEVQLDKDGWKLYIRDWIEEVNQTLVPRTVVDFRDVIVCQDHLHVFLVIQWTEYPTTINELIVGIE